MTVRLTPSRSDSSTSLGSRSACWKRLRELPDKQRADLRGHQLSPEVGQFVFCWHGRFPLSCEIARMADGRDCENSQSASNYFMENESCFHTLNRISL